MPFTELFDLILAYATVAGNILIVASLLLLVPQVRERLPQWIRHNGLWLAFIVALIATSGSLFYSEVLGYLPCKLCWFQRIFMYPLTLLLGIAAWKKHTVMALYGSLMSVIGAVIAAYHYALQNNPNLPDTDCAVVGYSASCSQYFVLEFGYVTIPLMALTAFILIIIFLQLNHVRSDSAQ